MNADHLQTLFAQYRTLTHEAEKEAFWKQYEDFLIQNPAEIKGGLEAIQQRLTAIETKVKQKKLYKKATLQR
jgi:hypothetical protein